MHSMRFRLGIQVTIICAFCAALIGSAQLAVAGDEWIWENPLPQGNTLWGVWGAAGDEVYAVGAMGTVLRYNGADWLTTANLDEDIFYDVWGAAPNDIYAVTGAGEFYHFNGATWSLQYDYSGYTWDLWGRAANDIYAVGDSGLILHYNGSAWSPMSSGVTVSLNSAWGRDDPALRRQRLVVDEQRCRQPSVWCMGQRSGKCLCCR
ncbi:MAG: hypothetical protein MUC85_06825 [Anaerolineales bacterium]|nr:hypothetical protein [Anaerolineales bacterium]